MGCLIRMNSEKLFSAFFPEFKQENFQFVLISHDIETVGSYNNIMTIRKLIPPPNISAICADSGTGKEYKKAYLEYLKKKEVESLLTIIIKGVAIDNMNIILLCTRTEDEYEYLKMICEFIEAEFKLKTYTIKEFAEDPKKAVKIKNKEEVVAIFMKKLEIVHEVRTQLSPDIDESSIEKKLGKMDKKEILKYGKIVGAKVDKNMDKKKLIKNVLKKVCK